MLAWVHAPESFGAWLQSFVTSPVTFLILVNILLLFIGMVMEVNAAKVMLLPVLFPISQQLGIDPIHFGVVVTVNLCIGLITPPIGIVLAIASQIGGVSIVQGARATMPFLLVALLVLLILTFVPVLSTFLPDLLMGTRQT